jgi:hypothetical protein
VFLDICADWENNGANPSLTQVFLDICAELNFELFLHKNKVSSIQKFCFIEQV